MMPIAAMRLRAAGGGGGGGSSYLDALATQPFAVYSLRKLVSTATMAIRVRRSSDNAEQDIGFSGDVLDTTALSSFAGAGSAFIVSVYDQTGLRSSATQTTAAKQPRIYNAGTYDGKIIWDGTDDALSIASLDPASAQVGVYAKIKLVPGSNFKMLVEHGADANTTAGGFGFYGYNNSVHWDFGMANGGSGSARGVRVGLSLSALELITALFNRALSGSDEIKVWRNGVVQSKQDTAITEQTGNFSSQTTHIGARTGTTLFADMWMESLVFYNADTESLRTSIEAIVS